MAIERVPPRYRQSRSPLRRNLPHASGIDRRMPLPWRADKSAPSLLVEGLPWDAHGSAA